MRERTEDRCGLLTNERGISPAISERCEKALKGNATCIRGARIEEVGKSWVRG